ncbi:unnamed protein product [Rotaria sp. Silwood2]|nr:unnamed protein product [Rotaria sp. Silwood2]CAF2507714.1 unnamed protein product [Rotaria sp. Silwood2]CAF3023000.1 unnamed protein product [Rotaria sp. Silwood2]CAF3897898.1 unnamed protein product [Rotaria sp. Silwood2]CAF4009784.1 unnamed protein product [Rotaria sp. Silwood2]
MACSKAEDLINQLIEATLKLLDFGLNIMDALRVQKLLTIRNQKIGLISDDACLPECSLRFSLNFDLMMFNKLLRNACLRARATLNELRVCRLRYPNAPLVLEPKTKAKFNKLQRKIQDFDEAVRSDKMIARRDLRDFREISIIFSQLEHDLKLLICSLECASTMKDTVLFAAPITDVMTVLSIVLSRLEQLAQKAEIDEKIAAAEQQKVLQDQNSTPIKESNSSTRHQRQQSNSPITRSRTNDVLFNGKNTNRTSQQRRRHDMTAMIAAASQQNKISNDDKNSIQSDTPQIIPSDKSYKESNSIENNNNKNDSNLFKPINRHYTSIKPNISRHLKKVVSPSIENIPDDIPSNRRKIKQYRNEFIQKWTNDARHIYARNHIIHASNIYSDQMIDDDLEKNIRSKQQKSTFHHHHHHHHHRHSLSSSSLVNNSHTSSSSLLNELYNKNKTKIQSSNSTSHSSIIENQLNNKHKNTSSNNSAIAYFESQKPHDNIECKIS